MPAREADTTHRVKIPSSTLPRAVVKDVICLMRFDINRLPRCIYIYMYTLYTFMCALNENYIYIGIYVYV